MDLKNRIEQLKDIQDGFTNLVLNELGVLSEDIQKEGIRRYEICLGCPLRDGNKCSSNRHGEVKQDFVYYGEKRRIGQVYSGCGCNLASKTVSREAQCPLGRWIQLVDNQ